MRHRTANNAIVDIGRVDPRALDRRGNGMGSERRRWRRVEGSSIGPPDWRPRCRNNYGVPHISHAPNKVDVSKPAFLSSNSPCPPDEAAQRSEEHTSALQSLIRNSSAVFCLKTKIS